MITRYLAACFLAGLLAACGEELVVLPTLAPRITPLVALPTPRPSAMFAAIPASPTASPVPAATAAPATVFDQYRAWMDEARALYPYAESVEAMWAVMICESKGDPALVADQYHGLFQYSIATWAGDWNPYRDSSIDDPRAQIFATAKAWHDGNQSWWGCYQT